MDFEFDRSGFEGPSTSCLLTWAHEASENRDVQKYWYKNNIKKCLSDHSFIFYFLVKKWRIISFQLTQTSMLLCNQGWKKWPLVAASTSRKSRKNLPILLILTNRIELGCARSVLKLFESNKSDCKSHIAWLNHRRYKNVCIEFMIVPIGFPSNNTKLLWRLRETIKF